MDEKRKEGKKQGRMEEREKKESKLTNEMAIYNIFVCFEKIPLPYCILIAPCVKCVIQIMFLLSN